jgi:MFS family permease
MTSAHWVTALTISGSVVFGMVLALLGHLKLTLARRSEQATQRIELLLSLLNLLLVPLMLAAGLLVDFWGVRPTIILGAILLALSFLALSAGAAYQRTVTAVLVAAFGASAVGVASLVLMPQGLFGLDERTASMQLGLVLVGLGALLAPPLIDLFVGGLGFGRTMAILAFVFLSPAFLAALPDQGAFGETTRLESLPALLQNPGVWLGGLVVFCYAPLEGFVSVWTVNHLTNNPPPGTKPEQARHLQVRWLARFWAAFLVSRLFFAFVEHAGYLGDEWADWFLAGTALLAVAALGNLAGASRPRHALNALVCLGFFLGPVLPFLIGLYFRLHDVGKLPGTSFGLLYSCGSLGSLTLAPLVGFSARVRNMQMALLVPLLIALVLTATTILFVLIVPMFIASSAF